jgi:hypothetical protein
MIVSRGYCSFCTRHVERCPGQALFVSGLGVGAIRICFDCARKAVYVLGGDPGVNVVPFRRPPGPGDAA